MPPLEAFPVEKTVILTFAFHLRLHSELHFLAYSGLKDVLLICTDWLPILNSIRVTRPSSFMMSQKDEGYKVFCMIHGDRWNRRDTRSPNFRVKRRKASDLPSLLVTNTSNFVENGGLSRSICDENVVRKKFDIGLGHVGMRFDESEKLGGVHGCYQVTGVEDRALDLEIPACSVQRIVDIDHTLYFGGLDDWIECSHLICDLNHLCCYGFSRSLRCWGK